MAINRRLINVSGGDIEKVNESMSQVTVDNRESNTGQVTVRSHGQERMFTSRLTEERIVKAWEKATTHQEEV